MKQREKLKIIYLYFTAVYEYSVACRKKDESTENENYLEKEVQNGLADFYSGQLQGMEELVDCLYDDDNLDKKTMQEAMKKLYKTAFDDGAFDRPRRYRSEIEHMAKAMDVDDDDD